MLYNIYIYIHNTVNPLLSAHPSVKCPPGKEKSLISTPFFLPPPPPPPPPLKSQHFISALGAY